MLIQIRLEYIYLLLFYFLLLIVIMRYTSAYNKSAASKNYLPLGVKMLETLMDCHERELMKLEPCNTLNTKFVKGLIERRMLRAAEFTAADGKKLIVFYITDIGRQYLNNLK